METNEIKTVLLKQLPLDIVNVSGDGKNFQIIAVSQQFTNMTLVKRQQIIYQPLTKYICDNRIHALSIKTYTPDEWKQYCQLHDLSNLDHKK